MKKCSIEHCEKIHEAQGLCPMHYWRLRTHGDPLYKTRNEMDAKERIVSSINIDPNTKCWEWLGSKYKQGYGYLSFQGKIIKAHRLSYSAFNGTIPQDTMVCHRCDNPACVNPEHLWIGSAKDNMKDKYLKQRENMPSGEGHYKAKLSNEKICNIKLRINAGDKVTHIARQMNISHQTVSDIKQDKIWRGV